MSSRRGRRSQPDDHGSKGLGEAPDDAIDAAVARFVDVVEAVRTRTSGRLVTAARALVYGLVIATASIALVVLLAVASIRALDIAVPGDVWSAHLIASGVFGGAGAWAWSKRRPRTASST